MKLDTWYQANQKYLDAWSYNYSFLIKTSENAFFAIKLFIKKNKK